MATHTNRLKKQALCARSLCVAALSMVLTLPVYATEYPIGDPVFINGMEVAAVFLQPIEMDPPGMMRPRDDSDIHLEADIHAIEGNPNGFSEGMWVPYLVVHYELTKLGTDEQQSGELMAMVASDGPHYGENVKLMGMGNYKLTITVAPPGSGPQSHFGRHADRETGVAPWFEPFSSEYEFTFAGTGKSGAY